MWVRLQTIQYISVKGKQETCYPGEWVQVGKQLAASWIISGAADRPDIEDLSLISDAGVQVTDNNNIKRARGILPGINMESVPLPLISYPNTFMWNGKEAIRPEHVASGFSLLDTWELVIPIWDYDKLARDVGSLKDREKTEAIIHDLRVPCYHPYAFFCRKCKAVEDVLAEWANSTIQESKLALLTAIYQVKPLILALPTTWVEK